MTLASDNLDRGMVIKTYSVSSQKCVHVLICSNWSIVFMGNKKVMVQLEV